MTDHWKSLKEIPDIIKEEFTIILVRQKWYFTNGRPAVYLVFWCILEQDWGLLNGSQRLIPSFVELDEWMYIPEYERE